MNKKLVVRVLENARKYKGSSIDYDPLVNDGVNHLQVEEAVRYCEEHKLLTSNQNERKDNSSMLSDIDGWWTRGLSRKGGNFLDEEFVDVNKLEHDYI